MPMELSNLLLAPIKIGPVAGGEDLTEAAVNMLYEAGTVELYEDGTRMLYEVE